MNGAVIFRSPRLFRGGAALADEPSRTSLHMAVSELPTVGPVKFPLFGTPPLRRVLKQLGVPFWHDRRFGILGVVLLGWLPVVVLCALQDRLFDGYLPAAHDFSLHARLLIALPTLLIGKLVTDALLTRAVNYLVEAGTVTEAKRPGFEAALRRTARLRDSWIAMLGLVALAFVLSAVEVTQYRAYEGSWRVQGNGSLSAAGYWYFLIARPLYFSHLLAWIWTFGLWTTLLVSLVRLPLRLFAFHADGAGGLEPLLSVHRTFIVLSFAIGTDLAGALANRMVHLNEPYTIYRTLLVLLVVVLTLVMLAPLTLLSRLLIPARYDAAEQFGAMTFELSRMLERDAEKGARSGLTEEMLTLIRSFSDSYGGHKIIMGTHFLPVTRNYALSFALAPTVPILCALLTRVPLLELFEKFQRLMHL
jgi:hypothetical protein